MNLDSQRRRTACNDDVRLTLGYPPCMMKEQMPEGNELETRDGDWSVPPAEATAEGVRLISMLAELFPASGSVADASLIDSAEGRFDISTPDDPTGEKLAGWLDRLSVQIDEKLTKAAPSD